MGTATLTVLSPQGICWKVHSPLSGDSLLVEFWRGVCCGYYRQRLGRPNLLEVVFRSLGEAEIDRRGTIPLLGLRCMGFSNVRWAVGRYKFKSDESRHISCIVANT